MCIGISDNVYIGGGVFMNTEEKVVISLKEEKSRIDSEKEILENAKKSNRKWISIWLVVVGTAIIERIYFSENASMSQSIISIMAIIIALSGLIVQSSNFDKNQKTQRELQINKNIIDDAVFLSDIKELNQEERAMRQLAKSQVDLEKYHSLNLSHTKLIFSLGVIIIFIGIIIIAGTLVIALINRERIDNILLAAGFIGGILVDTIGAIFIAMYTKTIDAANKYQASLVETTSTYLGNVLASQIQQQDLRELTWSDMAKELVVIKRDV